MNVWHQAPDDLLENITTSQAGAMLSSKALTKYKGNVCESGYKKVIWMTNLLFMGSVQCRVFVEGFLNHIPIIMKNNPVTVLQPERFMCVLLPYLRGLLSNNAREHLKVAMC